MKDRYLVKFTTDDGKSWNFGYLDPNKRTVTMPSGIKYPVDDDGYVIVMNKKYILYSATSEV